MHARTHRRIVVAFAADVRARARASVRASSCRCDGQERRKGETRKFRVRSMIHVTITLTQERRGRLLARCTGAPGPARFRQAARHARLRRAKVEGDPCARDYRHRVFYRRLRVVFPRRSARPSVLLPVVEEGRRKNFAQTGEGERG